MGFSPSGLIKDQTTYNYTILKTSQKKDYLMGAVIGMQLFQLALTIKLLDPQIDTKAKNFFATPFLWMHAHLPSVPSMPSMNFTNLLRGFKSAENTISPKTKEVKASDNSAPTSPTGHEVEAVLSARTIASEPVSSPKSTAATAGKESPLFDVVSDHDHDEDAKSTSALPKDKPESNNAQSTSWKNSFWTALGYKAAHAAEPVEETPKFAQ